MRIQDFSNTAEFLATMNREQLKEYAQNNAGNPYLVSLALFVSDQQKAMDRSKQAKAQPQGSVVDSAINNIAPMARATIPAEEVEFDMPEDSGIGQLPVDDTYFGANGGIIAFADGDLVTDPQFGGSIAQMEDDRPTPPKPTREQVNAIVQALRDNKQNVGLSTYRDIEEGKITAPTKSPVAAPKVIDLPPAASQVSPATASSAPMSAAPRGAGLPSLKPMDIQAMFEEAKKNRAVTDSPFKSQLEALASSEQEAAKAETTGLEKLQEKYADITKGQRARQDAKEKAIEAMDNQGIGIALLLYGAELMSKRNPDAGVAAKGYLANRDKVAAARDKLSESRDRLEAAEAERGILNATELNKLRANEKKVGIQSQKVMLKAVMDEYQVDKEEGLKILDLRIRQGLDEQKDYRADRRLERQISAKDKAPAQQVFDQFLREAGGNAVQAQKAYNLAFGDKNDPNKKYIELLLADKAKVIGGPLAGSELGLKQLANIDAEIARMSKASVSAKTATMADIEATAKAKGKTVQETLAAAKAQGFVVQ
jgi:hypothetical protein